MPGKARRETKKAPQLSEGDVSGHLPPGVRLARQLQGHSGFVTRVAWSPDGRRLASAADDRSLRIWDPTSGEELHRVPAIGDKFAWSPDGRHIAYRNPTGSIRLWSADPVKTEWPEIRLPGTLTGLAWAPTGTQIALAFCEDDSRSDPSDIWLLNARDGTLTKLRADITGASIAWSPDGSRIANAGCDTEANVLELLRIGGTLPRTGTVRSRVWYNCADIDWAPDGSSVATGSQRSTVDIWSPDSGRLLRSLEGHTAEEVWSVSFAADGRFLASVAADTTLRVWRCDEWRQCAEISLSRTRRKFGAHFADFHPSLPRMAVADGMGISILELDPAVLLGREMGPTRRYINAKVVLVGDTGVGKSGLSLVLNNEPYRETDSTAGRHVWLFASDDVEVGTSVRQTRETLLWDLAGQPGYRIIHQLHLNEVAVAVVVFDARSETDPLAGVRHWDRALGLAQQRQGSAGIPMKKILVSARNDRGGVSVSEDRLRGLRREFGFDGYFMTSAKEGWQIKQLREAIERAIPWEKLPEVSSSQLFVSIKAFLLEVKKTGRLLAPAGLLCDEFAREHHETAPQAADLRDQFSTCIGLLENRDLIRRVTFGGYVLLQPELLDAYASAMVNTAKEEPDGLGSLAEDIALAGRFFVPGEQRVMDADQEQLLLHATVEELVRHDLALRENADDGRYLVFPSQFNRDYEDAPEPRGKAVALTFEGPSQSLYSTLVVRLGHSGLFTAQRMEMWRNAAVFTAKAGGKCGVYLHEFAEARGRLILFFDEHASDETRFHFEEFILVHVRRRALVGSVDLVRFFVCVSCGEPVPDAYVKMLREKGQTTFNCPCGSAVSLAEPKERIHFRSEVEAMDRSADHQRDFEAFVVSARGETASKGFQDWAGAERVTLAVVFTDMVGSTALGEEIGDEAMDEVRRAHFAQSRKLVAQFRGREIKTIGDSFMTAFRSADVALDFGRALQKNTGHPRVRIRAGIHIGPLRVEEGDVFGGTVNFAARVVGSIQGAEIWLSDRAKDDIDRLGAAKHRDLSWQRHEHVPMKGFPGDFTLWAME